MKCVLSFGVWAVTLLLATRVVRAQGDGKFIPRGPERIQFDGSVTALASGQFNGDGHRDLVATRTGAYPIVILSDPGTLRAWLAPKTFVAPLSTYQIRAADLDQDGHDDLLLADPKTTGSVRWCNGDGTFGAPIGLPGVPKPRWMVEGDFDGDGILDVAAACHDNQNVALVRGRGGRRFEHVTVLPIGGHPHAVQVLDFDSDGQLDLVVGADTPELLPFRGLGNGTFLALSGAWLGLGCTQYLAVADFTGNGAVDVATACGVLLSLGDGSFEGPQLVLSTRGAFPAVGDFDGDGQDDLASMSLVAIPGFAASPGLEVVPGRGDGTFSERRQLALFGSPATSYRFRSLLAADLDGDGKDEIVTAAPSGGLTVVRNLEGTTALPTMAMARDVEIADFDRDGFPDVLLPDATVQFVSVFSGAELDRAVPPPLLLPTVDGFVAVVVEDLDNDGLPDIAGTPENGSTVRVLLFDAGRRRWSAENHDVGTLARDVKAAKLAGDDLADLVVLCAGTADLAVLNGTGGGAFDAAKRVPSLRGGKALAMEDLDRDGRVDAAVFSTNEIALHWGNAEGSLDAAQQISFDAADRHGDLVIADFDRDGLQEMAVSTTGRDPGIRLFKNLGARVFADARTLKPGLRLGAMAVADLDSDGWTELVTSTDSSESKDLLVVFRVQDDLAITQTIDLPESASVLRVADLNRDGAQDLVALGSSGAAAFALFGSGRPVETKFRRGDVDADGAVQVNDAVQVLSRLFLGGNALRCEDAADADDSGAIEMNDPIRLLSFLFLAGEPPAAPGPATCGPDVGVDTLSCGAVCP